jgi:membrane protease YdiL (CAAX protease family)
MLVPITQNKNTRLVGIGLVLCLVLTALAVIVPHYYMVFTHQKMVTAGLFFYSRLLFWMVVGVLFWYAQKIEHQPLLLWPERRYKFAQSFISVIGIMALIILGMAVVGVVMKYFGFLQRSDVIGKILKFSTPLKLFAVLTAAVTEELIVRGYAMPRLQLYFKKPLWPIVISTVLFGLGHITYGTVINVAGPLYIGLVFALYYQKYRNIKVLMICHFIIDFVGLILVHQ